MDCTFTTQNYITTIPVLQRLCEVQNYHHKKYATHKIDLEK
jgi:hypothetical protein